MSDHGRHFSSYAGHKERRTGKIRGAFSRMHRALDGWMLARAPASAAQGLHHHGPRYFIFSCFCTMCGLEKLGLVDHKWFNGKSLSWMGLTRERWCCTMGLVSGLDMNTCQTSIKTDILS